MNLTYEELLSQADTLIEIDRAQEALHKLADANRLSPGNPAVLCRMASAHMKLSNYKQALAAGQAALAADPNEPYAHCWISVARLRLGKKQESLQAATEAVRLSPEDRWCLYSLGCAQCACGQLEETIETSEVLQKVDPGYIYGFNLMARAYCDMKCWAEADATARLALELNPVDTDALTILGDALRGADRFDESLTVYVQILQIDPSHAWARRSMLSMTHAFSSTWFTFMVFIEWVVLMFCHIGVLTALGISLLTVFAVAPFVYLFCSPAIVERDKSIRKLPESYREFIARTWRQTWIRQGIEAGLLECVMYAVVAVVVVLGLLRMGVHLSVLTKGF